MEPTVQPAGTCTNPRDEQPLKQVSPIAVSDNGNVETEVRAVQSRKAESPSCLSVDGKETELRAVQPLKASSPICSRAGGKETEVNEVISIKVIHAMVTTAVPERSIERRPESWK